MDIVLVDTSAWINFFKGTEMGSSLFLKNNLGNAVIATCPIILQEVLQGIKIEKEFRTVNSLFSGLTRFSNDPYELAYSAAKLYRELRNKGITIRKPNDCLIALYAIKNNVSLLHDDKDFYYISMNSDLVIQQ